MVDPQRDNPYRSFPESAAAAGERPGGEEEAEPSWIRVGERRHITPPRIALVLLGTFVGMLGPLAMTLVLVPMPQALRVMLLVVAVELIFVPVLSCSTLFNRSVARALSLPSGIARMAAVVLEPRSFRFDDLGELEISGPWLSFRGDGIELRIHNARLSRIENGVANRGLELLTRQPIVHLRDPVDGVRSLTFKAMGTWTSFDAMTRARSIRRELEAWSQAAPEAS